MVSADYKNCEYCGTVFNYREPLYDKHGKLKQYIKIHYCSDPCRKAAHRAKIRKKGKTLKCKQCRTVFRVMPTDSERRSFCCRECWRRYIRTET